MKKNSIHLVKKIKVGDPQWYTPGITMATPVEYEYVYPKAEIHIKEELNNTKSIDWFLVCLVAFIILFVSLLFVIWQESFQSDFIDSVKRMSP